MYRVKSLAASLLGLCSLLAPSETWAQRYLSEFVGSSKVSKTTVQAQAQINVRAGEDTTNASALFNITKLSSTRDKANNALPFQGTFSLGIRDGTSNVVSTQNRSSNGLTRSFTHKGLLFANGDCTADLKRAGTTGNLDLVETAFDGEKKVFALIGSITIGANAADPVIPGGLSGTSVFVRPALTQIRIPVGSRTLTLLGSGGAGEISVPITLDAKRRHKTLAGSFTLPSTNEAFEVVASASRKWLYLVGVSASRYFTVKIAVSRKGDVFQQASGGTYRILNADNQVLETGTASVGPLN